MTATGNEVVRLRQLKQKIEELEAQIAGAQYTLPPATASKIGGVKPGSNLSVTSDGTLNATYPSVTGIPSGGTAGQVLTKDTSTSYDVSWQTPTSTIDRYPVMVARTTLVTTLTGSNAKIPLGASAFSNDITGYLSFTSNCIKVTGSGLLLRISGAVCVSDASGINVGASIVRSANTSYSSSSTELVGGVATGGYGGNSYCQIGFSPVYYKTTSGTNYIMLVARGNGALVQYAANPMSYVCVEVIGE